jgi:hypothetical protein
MFSAAALIALSAPASAGSQTFSEPMQGSNRLDWCLNWGTGCGAEAANAWCVANGFESASDFGIANDIGAQSPTRLITTGAVCDQPFCDGFSHITCFSATPTTVVYNQPKFNGSRLDLCVTWGQDCGQPAANAFCQWKGHASAVSYTVANDIGSSAPTRLIGTGALCDQDFCDGFGEIVCQD